MLDAPPNLAEHFQDPRFRGLLEAPTVIGEGRVPGRQATIVLHLRLVQDVVVDVRHSSSGCGYTIACGSILAAKLHRRTVKECMALLETLEQELAGQLPHHRGYCATLAATALRDALSALT